MKCPSRIDLDSIDRERFTVASGKLTFADGTESADDFVLIVPKKSMWEWDTGDPEAIGPTGELFMRSLVCRTDGTIVSAGFPKFFNLGEKPEIDKRVREDLDQGRAYGVLSPKLDGSLIIRSVIDGKVHFRTRGSLNLGDFADRILDLVRERHPALLDPKAGGRGSHFGQSQLFEYTSPKNQIVVRYGDCSLRQLAAVTFGGGHMGVLPANGRAPLERLKGGTTSVFDAPELMEVRNSEELARAVEAMRLEKGHEGVVLWTRPTVKAGATIPQHARGDATLIKIKTEWYLQLHALRNEASPKRMRQMIIQNDLRTWEGLTAYLQSYGVDWETAQMMRGGWDEATALRSRIEHILDKALLDIRDWAADNPPDPAVPKGKDRIWRKKLAERARELDTAAGLRGEDGKKLSIMGLLVAAAASEPAKVREARLALELSTPLPEVRRMLKEAAGDPDTSESGR